MIIINSNICIITIITIMIIYFNFTIIILYYISNILLYVYISYIYYLGCNILLLHVGAAGYSYMTVKRY